MEGEFMNRCLALALLVAAVPASAQVTPCAAFVPEPPPCATPAAPPAGAVAAVDGEWILLADLDPKVREVVEGKGKDVAEARKGAVKRAVERVLTEREAARRKVAAKDLRWAEVESKYVPPTDAEVAAEAAAHPDKYPKDPERAQARARAALGDARKAKLRDDFVLRLVKETPVAYGADPNAPGLAPDAVLATVGERRLTYGELKTALDTAAVRASLWPYYRLRRAVDEEVQARLATKEAGKRGTTVEELTKAEVDAKLAPVTEAEVAAAAKELAYWIGGDPARVKGYLEGKRRQDAEEAFDKRLRDGHAVKLLFEQPKLPKQEIATEGSPSRGDAAAPLLLVEFGDFECPPCGYVSGIVEEALKGREKQVRYVFREYPLPFHPFAATAAEAALAAHAQGKFFEYGRLLFANQKALDAASLKRYAAEAGLDAARFAKDLEGRRFAPDVQRDLRDGEAHGVFGTPALFLNGVALGEEAYSVEGLRAAFDRALATK